jgi:hypothetical protein
LKEEALDRIKWRIRFGRGCGPVVWQITGDDDDDGDDDYFRQHMNVCLLRPQVDHEWRMCFRKYFVKIKKAVKAETCKQLQQINNTNNINCVQATRFTSQLPARPI